MKNKKISTRITKIKPLTNKCNWEGINVPSEKDDWKKIQKNNVAIALNVFYAQNGKIYPAYISKHNSNPEEQIILLVIWNGERQWHYLVVKKLSALLRGITSKHQGDFYFLNCFHSFATEKKLESHKKVCENKDFCNVIVPSEGTKILEFYKNQKPDKAPFIIYADLKCIIEKIDGSKNNPEISSTTKVSEHIPSGFSMSTVSSFRNIENKHDVYRGKDCMKKFCESLREQAMKKIIKKKCKNLLYL